MSKRSPKHTAAANVNSSRTGRPAWLAPALLVLASIAIVSSLFWMAQRSQPAPAQTLAPQNDSAQRATGPRISVDQELFDYGDVKFNTPIETVVRVTNVGDQRLALERTPAVELVEGC